MTLPSRVFQIVRQFSVGEQVDLFQIDLTAQGGSVFYCTNNVFEERVAVKFGGNTYTYLPVAFDDIEIDANAAPSQPRLSLATCGGPVATMVQQYDDLRGATVTRMVTYAEFLDEMPDGTGAVVANPSADPTAVVRREVFQIDQKESIDNVAATFLCVAPVDVEGAMLPRRIVRKRWCDAMYRVYDADSGVFIYFAQADGGCPWGNTTPDGGKYFDEFDNPTTIDKDKCSKRLQGCYKRFGFTNTAGNLVTNVTLPAQMFPGVLATQEAG